MRDHFVLSVDRLLTETIDIRNHPPYKLKDSTLETPAVSQKSNSDDHASSDGNLVVQCRICHDEDEDCNLESPCSCCGSLKYAHRKCVQRWCNEKGDTLCEICLQQFKPGYTVPSQLFHYGGDPMNFRGSWEMSQRDLNNVVGDDDYYPTWSGTSVLYCRSVAVIFMILLVLRHTLPIIISGEENYSLEQFAIVILRIAGILVPIYAMVRALLFFHLRSRRHRRQVTTRM